jgi:hypothetical protein
LRLSHFFNTKILTCIFIDIWKKNKNKIRVRLISYYDFCLKTHGFIVIVVHNNYKCTQSLVSHFQYNRPQDFIFVFVSFHFVFEVTDRIMINILLLEFSESFLELAFYVIYVLFTCFSSCFLHRFQNLFVILFYQSLKDSFTNLLNRNHYY